MAGSNVAVHCQSVVINTPHHRIQVHALHVMLPQAALISQALFN